jgi:ankyrin repeat protein
MTALHLAARHSDDVGMLKLLLSMGADVNRVDVHGMTPVMYALHNGNLKVAEALALDPRTRAVLPECRNKNALVFACASRAGQSTITTLLDKTRRVDAGLATVNVASPTGGVVRQSQDY